MDKNQIQPNVKGFTFVELIVIITILAILATIAFFSFQGYTQKTRNSARLVNISDITQALQGYKIKSGKYPTPDDIYATGVIVGKDLFQVGKIGENISALLKFDKDPLDPSVKSPYAYGLTLDNKYFQVAGTFEGEVVKNTSSQTFAAIQQEKAKVEGNYKGVLTFSTSSGKYIANVPSLIFSRTGPYNLIQTNPVDDPYFIINNGKNLPYPLNSNTSLQNEGTADVLQQITGQNLSLTGVIVGDWATNSGNLVSVIGYPKDQLGYEILGNDYVMGDTSTPPVANLKLTCDILKNIQTNDSWSTTFLPLGNKYVFNVKYGNAGYEYWTTDGTSSGTTKLGNIRAGFSSPLFNNRYYFSGKLDTDSDYELWTTDGTSSGTYKFKDIYTGASSSYPSEFLAFNNKLYFSAITGSGEELRVTDGTAAGTSLVKDIYPGTSGGSPYLRAGAELNGKYLFRANTASGNELWITDGSAVGTSFVKDIYPGANGSLDISHQMIKFNGNIYFSAKDGATYSDYQIWKTDGTAAGTLKVTTALALTGSVSGYTAPSQFNIFNNELYFISQETGGHYISKLNTSGNLSRLKFFSSTTSPQILQEHSGYLYFTANDGATGNELWRTDGTVPGTTQVKDISDATASSYTPSILGIINNKLFVLGKTNSSISYNNLYVSDGTSAGTQIFKTFHPSGGGAYNGKFISILDMFLFGVDDGTNNIEFWLTKGDVSSTKKVDVTYNSIIPTQIYPDNILGKINNKLFFFAEDATHGQEIWTCSY